MTTVILFIFGLIVGSFLNVVGLRWNSGISLGGRSFCGTCGKTLRWHELIPVLSYFWQGGRCSKCRSKISPQYPLVELWTALIFVTVPYIYLPVFCIFIVITIYDLRHKIIPDSLVYTAILLSFLLRIIIPSTAGDWIAGPALFSFFALIWFLSRGRAMGFGDAKLALAIGWLLGAGGGYEAVVLAFWAGAAFGIISILLSRITPLLRGAKGITMKSEIPFAPFLVLGVWLSLILNIDLLNATFL